MKKVLLALVVLLVILRSQPISAQEGTLFHDSGLAPKISAPLKVTIPSDGLWLEDQSIDLTDDNINDQERRNSSLQSLSYKTIYSVTYPFYDHLCKSKWVAQNRFAFTSPLFILLRVFRI